MGTGWRSRLTACVGALTMAAGGLSIVGAVILADVAPAGAVNVSTDAEFRAALTAPAVSQIDLTANITSGCSVGYNRIGSTVDLVIDGHGFTIDVTGCNQQGLLFQTSTANEDLTLKNVTLKGGHFDQSGTHGGGGVQANNSLTLDHAAVINNVVTNTAASSAVNLAGGVYAGGNVTMINSTVAGNTVSCQATCNHAGGGGVVANSITAINSTISGNTADNGGFDAVGNTFDLAGGISAVVIDLVYSTIDGNSASVGANVNLDLPTPALTSFASVIGDAQGGGDNCSGIGADTSLGYSYEDSTDTCGFGTAAGDVQSGAQPDLSALAANGGVAQTQMPNRTSPLVEAIPPTECSTQGASTIVPLVDERGAPRPKGRGCDIGAVEAPAGTYTPLSAPSRILDTRSNIGLSGPFAGQQTRVLQVAGTGSVPASASAVLLNVTATKGATSGFLTLYPADGGQPSTSNLNFSAGQTVANVVLVRVGYGGTDEDKIHIANSPGNVGAGSVHVLADVVGYYTDATTQAADGFTGLTPVRILDTRTGVGLSGAFAGQQTRTLDVTAAPSTVPTDADAVVLNVTAAKGATSGFLTVFSADTGSPPTASNLNFGVQQTVANLVTVKIGTIGGADNKIKIANSPGNAGAGSVHVIADVVGYYKDGAGGAMAPIGPTRILDTRNGTGGPMGKVAGGATITVDPQTATAMADVGTYVAVIVNVTATQPDTAGFLTVFPSDVGAPTASNLNFVVAKTVPNLVKVKVGADGKIKIANSIGNAGAGGVHVLVDIVGFIVVSGL